MNDAGEGRLQLAMGVLMPYIADEPPEDATHTIGLGRLCDPNPNPNLDWRTPHTIGLGGSVNRRNRS